MDRRREKYFRISEWVGFFISVSMLVISFRIQNTKPNLSISIFILSLIPFSLIKLALGLIEKETIFSGMPQRVKMSENPKFYWIIISIYFLTILICSILVFRGHHMVSGDGNRAMQPPKLLTLRYE